MTRFYDVLKKSKFIHLSIIIVYYLLVVLPHEEVGKFIAKAFSDMSRDQYNFIILIVTLLGLAVYLLPIGWNIIRKRSRVKTALYLFANVFLAVLCFKLLFVVNVEAIHFIQYGVLAVLLFPLLNSYWKTAFWCMILGALDEAWQYFYLAPQRTNYYDFNDVIINTIGAGFGLIYIHSYGLMSQSQNKLFKSKEFYFSILFAIGTLALYAAGYLIRKPMTGFWQTVHPHVTYHVVYPVEGLLIVALLILFYCGLDRMYEE